METFRSDVSNIEYPVADRVSAKTIRHSILSIIQKDHPEFSHESFLSVSELAQYRDRYFSEFLVNEIGELSDLEQTVLASLKDNTTLTDKIDGDDKQKLTFGQRVADKMAAFGGSWTFIISFGVFIIAWISVNVFWLVNKSFDPYPFILLNLILSCLASLQAPVIMMSQNRQEEKDRERARSDYMINLKAELEIRTLHEKIDHFIVHQQQELLEVQKTQIEMMNGLITRIEKK